jgi:hypothetical protein
MSPDRIILNCVRCVCSTVECRPRRAPQRRSKPRSRNLRRTKSDGFGVLTTYRRALCDCDVFTSGADTQTAVNDVVTDYDLSSYAKDALTDIVEKASRQAVEYARQFEDPVTVLEDLTYIRKSLDCGKWVNRRRGCSPACRGVSRTKPSTPGFPSSTSTRPTRRKRATLAGTSGTAPATSSGVLTSWVTEYHAECERGGQNRWPSRPVGREPAAETGRR